MNENTLYDIGIIFINGRSSVYQVTGTELDWLYENMRKQRGYWNFSNDAGEDHLINLNNVTEIVSCEVEVEDE